MLLFCIDHFSFAIANTIDLKYSATNLHVKYSQYVIPNQLIRLIDASSEHHGWKHTVHNQFQIDR